VWGVEFEQSGDKFCSFLYHVVVESLFPFGMQDMWDGRKVNDASAERCSREGDRGLSNYFMRYRWRPRAPAVDLLHGV